MGSYKQRYNAQFRRLLKLGKKAFSTTKNDFLNMTLEQKKEVLKNQKNYTEELFKYI